MTEERRSDSGRVRGTVLASSSSDLCQELIMQATALKANGLPPRTLLLEYWKLGR